MPYLPASAPLLQTTSLFFKIWQPGHTVNMAGEVGCFSISGEQSFFPSLQLQAVFDSAKSLNPSLSHIKSQNQLWNGVNWSCLALLPANSTSRLLVYPFFFLLDAHTGVLLLALLVRNTQLTH
jgi:hypothetical protein